MNTFLYFLKNLKSVPMATTWGLEELAEMKEQQDLDTPNYKRPQHLFRVYWQRSCCCFETSKGITS